MKNISRFVMICVGGMIGLMVLGMILSAILGVRSEHIKEVDLIESMMPYRIAFFFLVVALWPVICRLMTRPKLTSLGVTDEEQAEMAAKRERDIVTLKAQWWKVGMFFLFFEVVIIQQFGL